MWKWFLALAKQIWDIYTWTILSRLLIWNLNENEIKELNEMHIRRENQLDQVNNENKRYSLIKQIVWITLQSYLKIILKDPKISSEQKSSLLELRKLF